MKPKDFDKNVNITAFSYNKNALPRKKPKFKVGAKVRISKYKHIFEKGYTANWTTEIFTIDKLLPTILYKLKDYYSYYSLILYLIY